VEGAPHADAWTLAGRTAAPNLQARHVIFTRRSSVRPASDRLSRAGRRSAGSC
jgi:hypothetical protein